MNLKSISSVVFAVGLLTAFASPALAESAQATVDMPILSRVDDSVIGTLYEGEIVHVIVRYKKTADIVTAAGVQGWVNRRKLDFDYLQHEADVSVGGSGDFDENIGVISGFGN